MPLLQGSVFYPCHCGGSNKGGFLVRIKGSWTWSYIREDNMGKSTVLFCGICLSTLILAVVLETVRLCSCVPRRVTSSEWWLWFTSTTNAPSISLILAQSVLAHMLSITAWHAKLQCVNINELEPSPRVDWPSLLHVACIHFHTPRSESSHLTF